MKCKDKKNTVINAVIYRNGVELSIVYAGRLRHKNDNKKLTLTHGPVQMFTTETCEVIPNTVQRLYGIW